MEWWLGGERHASMPAKSRDGSRRGKRVRCLFTRLTLGSPSNVNHRIAMLTLMHFFLALLKRAFGRRRKKPTPCLAILKTRFVFRRRGGIEKVYKGEHCHAVLLIVVSRICDNIRAAIVSPSPLQSR